MQYRVKRGDFSHNKMAVEAGFGSGNFGLGGKLRSVHAMTYFPPGHRISPLRYQAFENCCFFILGMISLPNRSSCSSIIFSGVPIT